MGDEWQTVDLEAKTIHRESGILNSWGDECTNRKGNELDWMPVVTPGMHGFSDAGLELGGAAVSRHGPAPL